MSFAKVDNNATPIGAPLTPSEISWQDGLNKDRIANDKTLEIALNNHKNSTSDLMRQQDEMWREVLAVRGIDFDTTDKPYTFKSVRGQVCLVEVTEEEIAERRFRSDMLAGIMGK